MKYVTKSLCAVGIAVLFISCASSGSGCYDFGDNTRSDNNSDTEAIECVSVSQNKNKGVELPTIFAE